MLTISRKSVSFIFSAVQFEWAVQLGVVKDCLNK